jgi:hypothetical protein
MARMESLADWVIAAAAFVLLAASAFTIPGASAQNSAASPPTTAQNGQTVPASDSPALPRGKKLMLKDGNFQLVREYQVQGDRVRYYSLDSLQWEEIPAALVDWEATKRIATDEAQHDAAILAKVRAREEARRAEPLDVDASLEVAPGVFLPPGENLFAYDGKSVIALSQAQITSKLAKGRLLAEVLVPVVSTRYTVSIQGGHAKFRVKSGQPEFYVRTVDAREPVLELIHAKVHGDSRQIEHLDKLFGEEHATRDTVPTQRWQVARGVYRFTLGQALPPGEYAFAEVVQGENLSVYVWDFGVDASSAKTPAPR